MLKPIGAASAAVALLFALPAVAQNAAPAAAPADAPAAAPAADAAATASASTPAASGTLIAVVQADPNLSTFAKLAKQANLEATLAGQGPLTLLAPTNAAFSALPAEKLAELEKPENAVKLQQVLMYHIIPGAAPSSAFKGTKGDVPSATPAKLVVDGTGATVKVNDATVTKADVAASNGAVHIIDKVLMAPEATAAATSAPTATPTTN